MFDKIKKLFNGNIVMSFKQGFELTDLAITTMYQGDKRFNFILDTGSNNNIIDSNILDELEYTPLNVNSTLFGAEGVVKEVTVCNMVFTYENKEFKYDYVVADMKAPFAELKKSTGVTAHGIVGAKFFHDYKYVLDFAELKAYCKA